MPSNLTFAAGWSERSARSPWVPATAATLAAIIGTIWLYREAALQAVSIWLHSSPYNYCLLVLPIVAYLVWDRRATLALLQPAPSFAGLALIPAFGAAWWLAELAGVAEGRQLALAFLLQAVLLTVLGWRVYRALLFPFLYLLLLVPTGEFLIDDLQELAVGIVTAGLRLSGIPVYRDGALIEIPAGSFIVEPGCAGLNFLLSSLALSLLFANLLYRDWIKHLICVAVALGAALLVNWLRIYGIIVIAYVTKGHSGLIEDHLLYGWALFAVVMGGLVALAQAFRDPPSPQPAIRHAATRTRIATFAGAAFAALLLAAAFPVATTASQSALDAGREGAITLPAMIGPWRLADSGSDGGTRHGSYVLESDRIDIAITDLEGSVTALVAAPVADGIAWAIAGTTRQMVRIDGRPTEVAAMRLAAGERRRTSWQWYAIGERFGAGRLAALWWRLRSGVALDAVPAEAISLSTNDVDSSSDALLQAFLDAWNIRATLRTRVPAG